MTEKIKIGSGQVELGELMHYASKYYDPVKAREYYLRTRQLKGRKKGKTPYVKKGRTNSTVSPYKQFQFKAAAERDAKISKARQRTEERKKKLMLKIREWNQRVTEKQKEAAAKITARALARIEALPDLPKGVDSDTRARLVAGRRRDIQEIRAGARREVESLREQTTAKRQAKGEATAQKQSAIARELKVAVGGARAEYSRQTAVFRAEAKAASEAERARKKAERESLAAAKKREKAAKAAPKR